MSRSLCLGILVTAIAGFVCAEAYASGSVGPGGKMTMRGAYSLGKSIMFRELVCRTCPIKRRGFNRERARSLSDSLSAAFKTDKPGTPDDDIVQGLCSSSDESCVIKIELVHYYIKRRFRL